MIPFDETREIKVAKGTSVILKVAADATKVIPDYCTIYYRTEEGDRGSVNMQKLGRIRNERSDILLRQQAISWHFVHDHVRRAWA